MHLQTKELGANDAQVHQRIKVQERLTLTRQIVGDTDIYQTR